MKKVKILLVIICILIPLCTTLSGCSASDSVKQTASTVSNVSVPHTPDKNTVITTTYPNRTEKLDEDLFKMVDSKSSDIDKLQILFKALNEDSFENFTMYNCNKVLSFTMDLLYEFLGTEQSYYIPDKDFEKLFGFPTMPLKEGRIIKYEGRPLSFGASADCKYVFYQRKLRNIVSAYKLYDQTYLRISDCFIIKTTANNSIIYTSGMTGMNLGAAPFIHAFKIASSTCTQIDALEKYKFGNKEFVNAEGTLAEEFRVKTFTEKEMVFVSGENDNTTLNAHYDMKKMIYTILN